MPLALRRIAPLAVSSKGGVSRCIGRIKGGLNSKLYAVVDGQGRSVRLHLTAGQISGFDGTRALLPKLPAAQFLLPDKGCDANWFREGLSLGIMYDAGMGVKKDFALAAKWFRKAVD